MFVLISTTNHMERNDNDDNLMALFWVVLICTLIILWVWLGIQFYSA